MTAEMHLTDLYEELMAAVPAGVQVLTLRDDDGIPRGMTVSSLTPVSADPPSVLVCIGGEASMRPTLVPGRRLCLSFLGPDQAALSRGFAFGEDDPFTIFGWTDGAHGEPVLDEAPAHLFGLVDRIIEHNRTAVTLIELTGGVVHESAALVYWKTSYFGDLVAVDSMEGEQ